MKPITRIDASKLYRRLGYMKIASKGARHEAAREMGADIIRRCDSIAPRDTNRYVRGWQQAGNTAGITRIRLASVKASGNHDKFVEILTKQYQFWRTIEEQTTEAYKRLYGYRDSAPSSKRRRSAGMTPGQREMQKRILKARRNVERAQQELERVVTHKEAAILIGGFTPFDKGLKNGGRSLTATVRVNIYGGQGNITDTPTETFVYLHNKEPHSQIVERNTKTLAKATAAAKALGLKTVGRKYIQAIKVAAGK